MFKKLILTIAFGLFTVVLFGQQQYHHGRYTAPKGVLRVLMVFVEIDWADSSHVESGIAFSSWPTSGQLPDWKDDIFDFQVLFPQQNQVSKYFDELSFGEYHVIADYHKDLITLPLSDFYISGVFKPNDLELLTEVIKKHIDSLSFNTSLSLSLTSFDEWESNNNEFLQIPYNNDGKIDHLMVFVRNHPGKGSQAGYSDRGDGRFNYTAFNTLPNTFSEFSANNKPFNIIKHEFSHNLFGGNDYHTVGLPGGEYTFMWGAGGYGAVSSFGGLITSTSNAFDRLRLKYKPSNNSYQISARSESGVELNSDLRNFELDSSNSSGIYVLRDFWSTGDALRIRLPYVNREETGNLRVVVRLPATSVDPARDTIVDTTASIIIPNQYLWIENRQHLGGEFSLDAKAEKGLYAYLQVGNDYDTPKSGTSMSFDTTFNNNVDRHIFIWQNKKRQTANYLHFLPSIGKYDSYYGSHPNGEPNHVSAYFDTNSTNPFSGFHHLMQPANDNNQNDTIEYRETVTIRDIYENLQIIPQQDFVEPQQGSTAGMKGYDSFTSAAGRNKIGLGENPAAVPVMTNAMTTLSDLSRLDSYNNISYLRSKDNRVVYLNGISVEVIEELSNGDIKVRVRFDDYEVHKNMRWCAEKIVLREKVLVKSNAIITIEEGRSPQRDVNPRTVQGGVKLFASPTTFVMEEGSYFELDQGSKLNIKNETVFDMQGGILRVKDGSEIYVDSSSKLIVDNLSQLQVFSGGKIKIDGQLIIKSDSGDARLSVGNYIGSTPATNQAVLEVNGNLTFENCAWKHIKNEGKYIINGSVNIAPNYDVELVGNSNSTTLLDLNTHLDLSAAKDVILKEAHIEGGSIKAENNRIHLFDLKTSTNYELNHADDLDVEYVDFMNVAGAALSITGHSPAKKARIKDCDFNGFLRGTEINNVPDITITNTSYQDASADAAITLKNSGIVAYSGDINLYGNQSVGIKLDHVSGFYFGGNATTVQADTGIKATESLVFIRNGATVDNCLYGVAIDGTFIQTGSSPVRGYYTSMLTVGDEGCGTIINNDKKGVFACNTLMNVDAALHSLYAATINGNVVTLPTNINSNHFYGNGQFDFKLSYTHDNPPAIIRAQGNFWNNQSPTTEVKGCTNCHAGDCVSLTFDEAPTSACNQSGSVCSVCNTNNKQWTNGTFNNLVLQNFISNYNSFIANDNGGNRNAFDTLAMLNMYQGLDTNENPQWYVYYPPQNDYIAVPEDVADMIQVAKVLYNTGISYSSARLKPTQSPDLLKEFYVDKELIFELLPNPAKYRSTVNIKQRDLRWYQCKVYNSQGKEVLYIDRFRDRVELDLSHLGKMGMYIVEVMSLDGSKRSVQKLIVEK